MTETIEPQTTRAPSRTLRWRVVDIVVASVLAVASGVVFWAWNFGYVVPSKLLEAVVPGLSGLTGFGWIFAGILGGLVIRKPGAALYVGLVGAVVSMVIGSQWGWDTVVSGVTQGLGAELVFAVFAYRRFGLWVAWLSGVGAVLLEYPHQLVVYYAGSGLAYQLVYGVSLLVSGSVLGGTLAWAVARGLAAAGALDRFAAGRERRAEV